MSSAWSHPLVQKYANFMAKLQDWLIPTAKGRGFAKLATVVNLQKAGTWPFCLALMFYYKNYSPQAWFYAVTHGCYGLSWLLKHCVFPDKNWERNTTLFGAINSWAGCLALYWIAPYLLISRSVPTPTVFRCALCCALSWMGTLVMMLSDAQKHFTLKAKRGLITDGMFKYVRQPNYLGEMLLYGGFAAMVPSRVPISVCLWVWAGVFLPNMYKNEKRMEKYGKAWQEYVDRTGLLLPKLEHLRPF